MRTGDEIEIDNFQISENSRPFIIAEAGVNYYEIADKRETSLLEAAKLMIKEAAKNGADAIKFQSYKANKLAAKDSPTYWDEKSTQREFFENYDEFDSEEFNSLASCAEKEDIAFMSTPFDYEAVDFLDELVPVFKIASADITNEPFLRYIAKKGKPIFLSTGAATIGEIEHALRVAEEEGNKRVIPLHCVLSYPTDFSDANLLMIKHMRNTFPGKLIGYSDHTLPDQAMLAVTTAAILGASVIEKHFTLDKSIPGNDHYHAMNPEDLKVFSDNLNKLTEILNGDRKKVIEAEKESRKYARRSLVARENISQGTEITRDMLTEKRPGTGISPLNYEIVVGRKAKRDISEDCIISWEVV